MAIAFVRTVSASFGPGTSVAPVLASVAAGNRLILASSTWCGGTSAADSTPSGVSSSPAAVWSEDAIGSFGDTSQLSGGPANVEGVQVAIWSANTGSAGSFTVTASWGNTAYSQVSLSEYSGIATSAALDKTGAAGGQTLSTSPSVVSTGTATTAADELVVAVFGASSYSNPSDIAIATPAGFTNRLTVNNAMSICAASVNDRVISATGTQSASFAHDVDEPGSWSAVVATYKAPGATGQQTVVLNSGSSWVVPAGVTSLDKVEAWGAGGSGGNRGSQPTSGGGGGGYSAIANYAVTAGASLAYSIGAGGAAQPNPADGFAGGDTFFVSTATLLAKGGGAGLGASPGAKTGGAGGAAASGVGSTKFSGGKGGDGSVAGAAPGGGGAASPLSSGAAGVNATTAVATNGGAAGTGGGAGGTVAGTRSGTSSAEGGGGGSGTIASAQDGGAGGVPGGGSGGVSGSGNSVLAGGVGQIRITYTVSATATSATPAGATLTATASLIPGAVTAKKQAQPAGAVLAATASLIPGTVTAKRQGVPAGATLAATASLIPGAVTAVRNASPSGVTLGATATLIPGTATATNTAPTYTVFTADPGIDGVSDDIVGLTLGMKFIVSEAGQITHLRMYGNDTAAGEFPNVQSFKLWNNDTQAELASVAGPGLLTQNGWVEVALPAPVSVVAGTVYLVSYHLAFGRYSALPLGHDVAITNGPLTALASGGSTGWNGCFKYEESAHTYPGGEGFNDTAYFADVRFSTAAAATSANPSGVTLAATASLIPGAPVAQRRAAPSGATLSAAASLIPGAVTASRFATPAGAALSATSTLIIGAVTAQRQAAPAGAVLAATASFLPGSVSTTATGELPGATFTATASLLPGTEQIANRLLQTANLKLSPWTGGGGFPAAAGVDGTTQDALLVTAPGGGAQTAIYQTFAVVPGQKFTFSLSAKLGTLPEAEFKIAIRDDTNAAFISFDVPFPGANTSDFVRNGFEFTVPAGCTLLRAYVLRTTATVGGTVYLTRPQVNAGAIAPYVPSGATEGKADRVSAAVVAQQYSTPAGAILGAAASLVPGAVTAKRQGVPAGATLAATASLIPGAVQATRYAAPAGATFTAVANLIAGTVNAIRVAAPSGATLNATASLIPGAAEVRANAAINGETLTATATLISGAVSVQRSVIHPGANFEATAVFLPGLVSVKIVGARVRATVAFRSASQATAALRTPGANVTFRGKGSANMTVE